MDIFEVMDHYNIKMNEIKLMVQDLLFHTEICYDYMENNWIDDNGKLIKIKLDDVKNEINKINVSISEISDKFESIEEKVLYDNNEIGL